MVEYNTTLPQLQQFQAPNMLGVAEHMQKMQTSNMLMQQRAAELDKENALNAILSRSGGKATPDVIKGLIASGNYEPALALQRHAASMGSIGVSTQAAQTALEESRLKLAETKRTLQAGAAARDFISGNDSLTDPDALTRLRRTNPDAYEAIAKFNGLTSKMTAEASTAKRLDDKAKLDLMQGTAALFAPAFATAQTPDQYFKLYDKLASVYPDLPAIASREFTPENVRNIVQTGTSAQDLEAVTIGGRPAIRNKRTGQIQMSETGAPGANAAMPAQTAAATPPAAAGMSPAAPQTVEQILAAAEARKAEQVGAETTAREIAQSSVKTTQEEASKKQNAAQVLKLVADPELENIVKKSTSGLLETGGALARGAFGTATPGMTNINRLETFQSKILLDFVNGKLGAGFSNEDRRVVEKMVGRIADPLVPANSRLATLRDLKSMLESAASGEPMQISPAAEDKKTASVPPAGALATAASKETKYTEGQTATGPNGAKLVFRNGQWTPQ